MQKLQVIVLFLVHTLNVLESAKILGVFPTPSISHQVAFRPLMCELAKRGHDVFVITTDPIVTEIPLNLTQIDVHDMSYDVWQSFYATSTGKKDDIYTQIKVALKLNNVILETQIRSEEVQKFIQSNNHFDLVFIEEFHEAALIFAHIFKAPAILFSSLGSIFGNYGSLGVPIHPLIYPMTLSQRVYNLTWWEKLQETYAYYFKQKYFYEKFDEEDVMLRRNFGENIPTIREMFNNVQMLFLNVHRIWDMNRPVPPSIIYLGGIHQGSQKNLSQDIKSYLDSSKHGVIYVSFGTNVDPKTLPREKLAVMVNVFSELRYDILWKSNQKIPDMPKNIRTGPWFQQADLLRHPNVKLFITQGGLQSTDESITAGVPLIGIPLLADQWFNTEHYERHGIGKQIMMEALTEAKLKESIETVVEDKSYRESIIKLRNAINDQPMKPLERAVWWTEHVLRHGGGKHLQSPAANMPWSEYYELNLLLTLALCLVTFTVIVISVICIVLKKLYFSKLGDKTSKKVN